VAADDVVHRPASAPDADLACEFATARESVELRNRVTRALLTPVRSVEGGIEARVDRGAWQDVLHYIEVEARCCPFLDIEARRSEDAIVLRVTGRAGAEHVIASMFGIADS